MTPAATFDPARELTLYFRINRDGAKILAFFNPDGTPKTISNLTFDVQIRANEQSTVIIYQPTLTFPAAHKLQLAVAASAVNKIRQRKYFWEMTVIDGASKKKTYLAGDCYFHEGKFDGVGSGDTSITISPDGEDVNITVLDTLGFDLTALIASVAGKMDKSANLSDVVSAVTSRNNLGVGFNWGAASFSGSATMAAPLPFWTECTTNALDAELSWPNPATWPVVVNRPYFFQNIHPTNRFGIRAGGSLFSLNPGDTAMILCFDTSGGGFYIGTVVPSSSAISAQIAAYLEGLAWKQPCRASTTVALPAYTEAHPGIWSLTANANGVLPAIDGITLNVGDRVLVKDEAGGNLKSNGIYKVQSVGSVGTPWSLSRDSDGDPGSELQNAVVSVSEGSSNADTSWRQTTDSVTLGSSAVVWASLGTSTPDATASVKGKARLYTASGSNVDGSMDQNSITAAIAVVSAALALKQDGLVLANRYTADHTLVLGDVGKIVEMNVAGANNLNVPTFASVPFPVGTQIPAAQYGAGTTTVVPLGGVTIRSDGGKLKFNAQYAGATLLNIATNEWYLFGDIKT